MPTDFDTIASYDKHANQYASLQQSGKHIAHDFLEKPAMYRNLPDIKGKKVLCIGSASGEECEYLSLLGAVVVGIDASEGLVKIARYTYPEITFEVMNMEKLNFADNEFDVVFSSLTFHYSDNILRVLQEVKRVLKDGGECLFSMQHPVKWGALAERSKSHNSFTLGYKKHKLVENSYEIYGDYLTQRFVNDTLFGTIHIKHYHRPISAIIQDILVADLELVQFLEPQPTKECKKLYPDFYDVHSKIPLFMIFKVKKRC